MRLYFSPTSPYVRKVMVTAIETGLESRIDKIVSPGGPDEAALARANPLAKVPALVLDDGDVLYDSPVICEYLDSQHAGTPVFPAKGPDRWTALRRQALGDGILDAAILRRMETMRPAEQRSADAAAKQERKVTRGLDALEAEAEAEAGQLANPLGKPGIGDIAAACALGYLDLRFAAEDWRAGRPALAAWYEGMAKRRSLRETQPAA
jgi:glutathione S-transferase